MQIVFESFHDFDVQRDKRKMFFIGMVLHHILYILKVNVLVCHCALLVFVHMQGSNVMEDQDLRDMGITDPGHRKKILHAARNLPKVWFINHITYLQN